MNRAAGGIFDSRRLENCGFRGARVQESNRCSFETQLHRTFLYVIKLMWERWSCRLVLASCNGRSLRNRRTDRLTNSLDWMTDVLTD